MRIALALSFVAITAGPAAGQVHPRHTAAHDSAHAIVLTDEQHVALHQFLLGHWVGVVGHDSLHVRFEDDSLHQQLMIRQHERVSGFEIRGDTLRWSQALGKSACTAATTVSALLEATKTPADKAKRIPATMTCGQTRSPLTLTKSAP